MPKNEHNDLLGESASESSFLNREFPMSDSDFNHLSKWAYQYTGIVFSEQKKNLLYNRISRRVRRLNLKNFSQYCHYLNSNKAQEQSEFLNAITTNLTSFFRERHHFDFLIELARQQRKLPKSKDYRIWSAGCSTGEEAYSIAMTYLEHFNPGSRCKILATDIDSNVLSQARKGVYDLIRLESIEQSMLKRYFEVNKTSEKGQVKPCLKDMITFNRLNLLEPWPITRCFDVIFCRNVLIYFDAETQITLIKRFVNHLHDQGYLIIGHSENIISPIQDLHFLGKTIYQKRIS